MIEDKKEIILNTSDKAAKFVNKISGWVSRYGRFYGDDERIARWDGCTHVECEECHKVIPRGRTICGECCAKHEDEKYAALPKVKWDGKTPLANYHGDDYFFDEDDIDEFCQEFGCDRKDLQLVLCKPNYAHEIDPREQYEDILPDDECVIQDEELEEAFNKLNAIIREGKFILSWSATDTAAEL